MRYNVSKTHYQHLNPYISPNRPTIKASSCKLSSISKISIVTSILKLEPLISFDFISKVQKLFSSLINIELQGKSDLVMELEISSPCQCPKINYFPLQLINIEPQHMYTHSFPLPPARRIMKILFSSTITSNFFSPWRVMKILFSSIITSNSWRFKKY